MLILGWVIIGICTYYLSMAHIEKFAKNFGGFEGLAKIVINKEKEFGLVPTNVVVAGGKTIIMLACCVAWPYFLYGVIRGHINPARTEDKLKTAIENWLKSEK